jgi:hypothetical protein
VFTARRKGVYYVCGFIGYSKRSTTIRGITCNVEIMDSVGKVAEDPEVVEEMFQDTARGFAGLAGLAGGFS